MYVYVECILIIVHIFFIRFLAFSVIELDDGTILTGKPDQFHGKNYQGFRLKFSQQNQSIDSENPASLSSALVARVVRCVVVVLAATSSDTRTSPATARPDGLMA